MKLEILTHADAIRHTLWRMVVATGATVTLTFIMIALVFGTDPNRDVSVENVEISGTAIGAIIAALVAGILTYRSTKVMKELNQERADALQLSYTDHLTGLLNRRGYNAAAVRALSDAGKAKVPSVVFMCDIDRFKAINDRFGHEFGDKVLVEISEAIRAFAEKNSMLVGRLGGEEFAALMVDVTTEQAIQHANALRRICATTEISSNGASARVTVSIGVASSERAADLSDMMRSADLALYEAKNGGRNRVAIADTSASAA